MYLNFLYKSWYQKSLSELKKFKRRYPLRWLKWKQKLIINQFWMKSLLCLRYVLIYFLSLIFMFHSVSNNNMIIISNSPYLWSHSIMLEYFYILNYLFLKICIVHFINSRVRWFSIYFTDFCVNRNYSLCDPYKMVYMIFCCSQMMFRSLTN